MLPLPEVTVSPGVDQPTDSGVAPIAIGRLILTARARGLPVGVPVPGVSSMRSSALPVTSEVPRFDVVEAITPVGTAPCAECRGHIVDTYFEADQSVICGACHTRIAADRSTYTSGGVGRALVFGIAAAVGGAGAYFALLATTGREASVLILLLGFLVGKAVRTGSRGRGARRFQWLAVLLTYVSISATYVPFVMKGYSGGSAVVTESFGMPTPEAPLLTVAAAPAPVATAAPSLGHTAIGFGGLLVLAIAAPLLEGANNLFGLLFTLGALVQAWRMNRPTALVITGPYHVRASAR
jgi:hypothetical protein